MSIEQGLVASVKITLKGIRPPIWRRVLVPDDITLGELHLVIQDAMGWTDSHLHVFQLGRTVFSADVDPDELDEALYRLTDLLAPGKRMKYIYDFGDHWEHEVLFEKYVEKEDRAYPVCIKGKRACPPEDVGGIYGYSLFLEARANPQHPEHEEYMEWGGDHFDPEHFDPGTTSFHLGRR